MTPLSDIQMETVPKTPEEAHAVAEFYRQKYEQSLKLARSLSTTVKTAAPIRSPQQALLPAEAGISAEASRQYNGSPSQQATVTGTAGSPASAGPGKDAVPLTQSSWTYPSSRTPSQPTTSASFPGKTLSNAIINSAAPIQIHPSQKTSPAGKNADMQNAPASSQAAIVEPACYAILPSLYPSKPIPHCVHGSVEHMAAFTASISEQPPGSARRVPSSDVLVDSISPDLTTQDAGTAFLGSHLPLVTKAHRWQSLSGNDSTVTDAGSASREDSMKTIPQPDPQQMPAPQTSQATMQHTSQSQQASFPAMARQTHLQGYLISNNIAAGMHFANAPHSGEGGIQTNVQSWTSLAPGRSPQVHIPSASGQFPNALNQQSHFIGLTCVQGSGSIAPIWYPVNLVHAQGMAHLPQAMLANPTVTPTPDRSAAFASVTHAQLKASQSSVRQLRPADLSTSGSLKLAAQTYQSQHTPPAVSNTRDTAGAATGQVRPTSSGTVADTTSSGTRPNHYQQQQVARGLYEGTSSGSSTSHVNDNGNSRQRCSTGGKSFEKIVKRAAHVHQQESQLREMYDDLVTKERKLHEELHQARYRRLEMEGRIMPQQPKSIQQRIEPRTDPQGTASARSQQQAATQKSHKNQPPVIHSQQPVSRTPQKVRMQTVQSQNTPTVTTQTYQGETQVSPPQNPPNSTFQHNPGPLQVQQPLGAPSTQQHQDYLKEWTGYRRRYAQLASEVTGFLARKRPDFITPASVIRWLRELGKLLEGVESYSIATKELAWFCSVENAYSWMYAPYLKADLMGCFRGLKLPVYFAQVYHVFTVASQFSHLMLPELLDVVMNGLTILKQLERVRVLDPDITPWSSNFKAKYLAVMELRLRQISKHASTNGCESSIQKGVQHPQTQPNLGEAPVVSVEDATPKFSELFPIRKCYLRHPIEITPKTTCLSFLITVTSSLYTIIRMQDAKSGPPRHYVRISCNRSEDTIETWPSFVSGVTCNDVLMVSDRKRCDGPIVLNAALVAGSNKIALTCDWDGIDEQTRMVAVDYIVFVDMDEAIQVVKKQRIDFKTSWDRYLQSRTQTHGDSPTALLDLVDPTTRKKLEIPVRTSGCAHVACFDLQTYLKEQLKHRKFTCPICHLAAGVQDLLVDGWIEALLSKTEPDETNVLLKFPAMSSTTNEELPHSGANGDSNARNNTDALLLADDAPDVIELRIPPIQRVDRKYILVDTPSPVLTARSGEMMEDVELLPNVDGSEDGAASPAKDAEESLTEMIVDVENSGMEVDEGDKTIQIADASVDPSPGMEMEDSRATEDTRGEAEELPNNDLEHRVAEELANLQVYDRVPDKVTVAEDNAQGTAVQEVEITAPETMGDRILDAVVVAAEPQSSNGLMQSGAGKLPETTFQKTLQEVLEDDEDIELMSGSILTLQPQTVKRPMSPHIPVTEVRSHPVKRQKLSFLPPRKLTFAQSITTFNPEEDAAQIVQRLGFDVATMYHKIFHTV
ncbi:uncharacterized protein SPPG_03143 [Spizellomyces punctatus DAOM BR117]|uniref:SP-RING-type domain-containing protein n=1 Tax=Spizellomyces punctatus (strain DAOM BR117) TaxID=645134 RepID=A0A0L0HKB0_SPIPD|nr:uncharacterized protein SPPG_03143 [Spizellomyces punctatus DAOM BR117]KND01330.1 hypothetical protein SPPG_03143 [Spizellomyces punctatus DAOM BR117]|eukprot:XP_016609369.1 hypothetical protein SPPG_03143 [Spizellomyces punctatus DAOM BR117]